MNGWLIPHRNSRLVCTVCISSTQKGQSKQNSASPDFLWTEQQHVVLKKESRSLEWNKGRRICRSNLPAPMRSFEYSPRPDAGVVRTLIFCGKFLSVSVCSSSFSAADDSGRRCDDCTYDFVFRAALRSTNDMCSKFRRQTFLCPK